MEGTRHDLRVLIAILCAASLYLAAACSGQPASTQSQPAVPPDNEDQFAEFYPQIATEAPSFGAETPLEPEVVVWSELKSRKATLLRSDGSKVPYEKEVGVVTIESNDVPRQYLLFKRFRNIDMKWNDERLLFFSIDIGHAARVEAVFDAASRSWIYRKSVQFGAAVPKPEVAP